MRITALALATLCGATLAAADTPLITGGAEAFAEVWCGGLTKTLVDAADQGGKAIQLVVAEKPEQPWGAQTWVTPLAADIAAGDTVKITLTARCTSPEQGEISVAVGMNAEPWTQTVAEKLTVGKEWKEYTISGVAGAALAAANGRFGFSAGYQVQTLEIAKITVVDLGKQ